VRELVRRHLRFFVIASAAAIILRLIFLFRFPGVVTDSFIYGDIAKNWLLHGVYGLGAGGDLAPTYIRLPGYPAFLACVFAIFGMDHYRAVLVLQMFADVGTCFICASIAFRLLGPRSAKAAFLLAALCPFLADYTAAALTETLEVFFTALTLDLVLRALQDGSRYRFWLGSGAACGAAILLRPDGALLLIAIEGYVAGKFLQQKLSRSPVSSYRKLVAGGLLLAVISVIPLAPWAVRNWRVFHRFQPLAPRYANEEDEFVPMGFNRWVKTWIADYTSVEEVYWPVPGSALDVTKLPRRAFDTPKQYDQTAALIDEYNDLLHVSPELDDRFEGLAAQRIRAHPFGYYLQLPLLRITDMWLRPRTEKLPCDSRWWELNDEPQWSALAIALGVLNLAYVGCAVGGWVRSHNLTLIGVLVLFVTLRSAFLGSLENPEPRYTLEMYPVVIVFAASAITRKRD
jgi:4-amino-4-deoxy-L-arabinose transferase-like glycosyltransferase